MGERMSKPNDMLDAIKASIPSEEAMRANEEKRLVREDKTCLSYWFPKVEAAGLLVPKTRIVSFTDYDTARGMFRIIDGSPLDSAALAFMMRLTEAVVEIGCPCFLRTGQTSGKHSWKDTCYLKSPGNLLQHVGNLIEFSECADFMGLAWNVWAVRELLPTLPVCTLPRYGDMPLCREFRCFVHGGTLLCIHPYWPRRSVEEGFPWKLDGKTDDVWGMPDEHELPSDFDAIYERVSSIGYEAQEEVIRLATRAGSAVGGRWSVDILDTSRGWCVTDMAEMDKSWHWPECVNAPKS